MSKSKESKTFALEKKKIAKVLSLELLVSNSKTFVEKLKAREGRSGVALFPISFS